MGTEVTRKNLARENARQLRNTDKERQSNHLDTRERSDFRSCCYKNIFGGDFFFAAVTLGHRHFIWTGDPAKALHMCDLAQNVSIMNQLVYECTCHLVNNTVTHMRHTQKYAITHMHT